MIALAETLKSHGYATANYDKAHVRVDPTTYGFDEEITGWVRSYRWSNLKGRSARWYSRLWRIHRAISHRGIPEDFPAPHVEECSGHE
jgi:arylsulfatase A-like enzyme